MAVVRRVGVVTTSRADYGIYRPVLRLLEADAALSPGLFVGGTHLSVSDGATVDEIERDGFEILARVDSIPAEDSALGVAAAMAAATSGFAEAYQRHRPDVLLALGDRFEMHAAVTAAQPFRLPVAHLHGGERTAGAMDDALRHSITKLSHLHFASTEAYAARIRQLGEEPWRVHVTGAPGLDNVGSVEPLARDVLEERIGLRLDPSPLLVTFHPVTLEADDTDDHVAALLEALGATHRSIVFTYPNVDLMSGTVRRAIGDFVAHRPGAVMVASLGTQAYFTLMRYAAAMVGNSSSGIIEAPSFHLPVVDIGSRQAGRIRAPNVIHAGYSAAEIGAAIERATSPEFRAGLEGLRNPYGDGRAAARIVDVLRDVALDDRLIAKGFVDL